MRFYPGQRVEGQLRLSNQFYDELGSVRSDAVACKYHVRPPREQFAADDLNYRARLLRVAPAAMEDVLVFKPEVTCEGNAFAAQLRRVDR